jgi:hypothetical protein
MVLSRPMALYMETKNFRWHVSGPHLRDYHLLLAEHREESLQKHLSTGAAGALLDDGIAARDRQANPSAAGEREAATALFKSAPGRRAGEAYCMAIPSCNRYRSLLLKR